MVNSKYKIDLSDYYSEDGTVPYLKYLINHF